jgi:rhamnosyltransferase
VAQDVVNKVVAIVVTYQPAFDVLSRLIVAIQSQVNQVLVVDNASGIGVREWLVEHHPVIHLIDLDDNYGIGKAQNIGIDWARQKQASHVLLCDQDSTPKQGMVQALLDAEQRALADGVSVAATGPRYHDPVDDTLSGFVVFNRLHFSRVLCDNQTYIPCEFVIASGCLIRMSCLDHIGGMDEDLFIDHVDTDWCLRGHSLGYQIIGACHAVMQHDLGEERVDVNLLGRRRQVSVHQPYRQYYVLRNSILLYQKSYTSWHWIGGDFVRLVQRFIFFSLFQKPRQQNFVMMIKGVRDGLLKRTGRFQQ